MIKGLQKGSCETSTMEMLCRRKGKCEHLFLNTCRVTYENQGLSLLPPSRRKGCKRTEWGSQASYDFPFQRENGLASLWCGRTRSILPGSSRWHSLLNTLGSSWIGQPGFMCIIYLRLWQRRPSIQTALPNNLLICLAGLVHSVIMGLPRLSSVGILCWFSGLALSRRNLGILCLFFPFIKSYSDLSNGLPPFNWGIFKGLAIGKCKVWSSYACFQLLQLWKIIAWLWKTVHLIFLYPCSL